MFHADTTGMSWKSISITFEDHARLARLSREFGDAKLSAMFAACINAFEAISPEQQLAAIKGKSSPSTAPVGSALADDDSTIIEAGASSVRCASALMTTVAKATQDGDITDAEASEINAEASALVASACSCAAAAKKRRHPHN